MKKSSKSLTIGALAILSAVPAQAVLLQIEVTAGPLTLAPSYGRFSSSNTGLITGGTVASPGLEQLAEDGGTAGLIAEEGGFQISGPTPAGSSNVFTVEVAAGDHFFDFAAMLLPSNDFFVGTGAAVAPLDVSSILGGTASSLTLSFTQIYDAGTELEDFDFVAPPGAFGFGRGQTEANQGADENGVIRLVDLTDNPFESFLNPAQGADLSQLDPRGQTLATITISQVPEPSSILFVGLAGFGAICRRKR